MITEKLKRGFWSSVQALRYLLSVQKANYFILRSYGGSYCQQYQLNLDLTCDTFAIVMKPKSTVAWSKLYSVNKRDSNKITA
jgi:hypothetical protein